MEQFAEALDAASLKILAYDSSKQKSVRTHSSAMTVEKFSALFLKNLGERAIEYKETYKALHNLAVLEKIISEYAEEKGIATKSKSRELPENLVGLTLNCDMSAKSKEDMFFMTTPKETISVVTGAHFVAANNLQPADAIALARKVIVEYLPRNKAGVFVRSDGVDLEHSVFNSYMRPPWKSYQGYKDLPQTLPSSFKKLVEHLFPLHTEREYLYSWMHDSLFKRAPVFLVLCSFPGTGKNRLKLIMRALHGHANTVDIKRSTYTERFNAQHAEATLGWSDELKYNSDMENVMKELQNDTISIEKKGRDATRASKVYASYVISNNRPRDNFIDFNSRKFVPLVMTAKRLEESMSPEEIDVMTKKVEDQKSETYDVRYIAQIAKWIKRYGRSEKWPTLEYQGPMFWKLAHTSMTAWQKKVIHLMETEALEKYSVVNPTDGFLWSTINQRASRKATGDRTHSLPDFTSVMSFFEAFRDDQGRKAFTTKPIKGILGDFWVKPLFKKVQVMTEGQSIVQQRERANEKIKKEKYDL